MSAELDRFEALLTGLCGIQRTRLPEIDAKAAERAQQAREQVGLTGATPIHPHPTGDQIRAVLGWTGEPIGAGELATWNYEWRDPIAAAANGLWNSPEHHAVLANPGFTHWGLGLYAEVAPQSMWPEWSNAELETRRYFILWLTTGVPKPKPVALPLGATPIKFLGGPAPLSSVVVGPNGFVNVRLAPDMAADQIDFSTASTGPLRVFFLGDVEGDVWNGSNRWSALWIPDRGGFRYCHATLRSTAQPVNL